MSWWSPAPRPSGGFPKWEMGLGAKQRETTHYPSGNRFFNVLLILLALHLTKGSLHARHEDSCVMLPITDERAGKVRHLQAADDMQHGLLGNPWNIPKVGMFWVVKLCLSSRAGLWSSGCFRDYVGFHQVQYTIRAWDLWVRLSKQHWRRRVFPRAAWSFAGGLMKRQCNSGSRVEG